MHNPPNPVDLHVGSRVRMRRLMLKMSQTDLAQVGGITFQQVQKYENGINRISSSRLQQFARVLKVPISFFFEGQPSEAKGAKGNYPENQEARAVYNLMATKEGLALANAFQRINNRKLRLGLVRLVEHISGE
jgi:transcriptional regulator with XRE-family HTH domain